MTTEFFEPHTTEGDPVVRRRSIVDRQATAQRFLMEAADDVYDGELDIDWDAPPVPGKPWLPDEMVTLHGTKTWKKLTPEQRDDLAKRELVNLLTVAVYAETVLSMLTFREIAEEQLLADDRTRWQFKCVNTHSRNITMFGRLIDATGLPPYTRMRLAKRLERYTLLLPAGPVTATVCLLLESATQGLMRLASEDTGVQPHVAQIMMIHLISSRRHSQFAREELEAQLAGKSAARVAVASVIGAWLTTAVGKLLVNDAVFRDAELDVRRSRRAALRSPSYRRRMDAAFADAIDFAAAAGLFRDRASRAILRRGHAPLPARRTTRAAG
ncbi:hypothetical protein GOARA_051_00320 [Gordonia araii NBRC 100433]|uniref:Diiron oxygenase n=1 Tax=Gordonia araii NBRC 100433 TaxID=1073574 RepID=G7H2L3_9ACTN|nr:diiron oxygenase [Gordonia araii]NNG97744.1 hypothetical protein [Gordonia araii NBRC 100433]GAB10088.1 hypothetical protein GOARA_051_00320 [Gordonia araii NBRC 100433]